MFFFNRVIAQTATTIRHGLHQEQN